MNSPLHKDALKIVQKLQHSGYQAFYAGGCVRDHLMQRSCKDIDIATDAKPDDVLKLFPSGQPVGKAFGVILIKMGGNSYDVATFREDHDYVDGRHPGTVSYTDIQGDSARRDFTINAMYWDPLKDHLLDFHQGQVDIKNKLIRCVGIPSERFSEDYLRMIRAVRFASNLGFSIEEKTLSAIAKYASTLSEISVERIREEFSRSWEQSVDKVATLKLYEESGILSAFFPRVATQLKQGDQPEYRVLEHLPLHDVAACLAAILHGQHTLCGNFSKIIEMNADSLEAINLKKSTKKRLSTMLSIQDRLFDHNPFSLSEARFLMADSDSADGLILHYAICRAQNLETIHAIKIEKMMLSLGDEQVLPKPWLNGHDLMLLGVKNGPILGNLCREAYVHQLNRAADDKEHLLLIMQDKINEAV